MNATEEIGVPVLKLISNSLPCFHHDRRGDIQPVVLKTDAFLNISKNAWNTQVMVSIYDGSSDYYYGVP